MIIEFKSKAAGAFFMTEPVARMVFSAMGQDFAAKGIFTVEQLPIVRERLQSAIEKVRSQDRSALNAFDDASAAGKAGRHELPLGLSQRAYPLLEMLISAEKKKVPVVWGV